MLIDHLTILDLLDDPKLKRKSEKRYRSVGVIVQW